MALTELTGTRKHPEDRLLSQHIPVTKSCFINEMFVGSGKNLIWLQQQKQKNKQILNALRLYRLVSYCGY